MSDLFSISPVNLRKERLRQQDAAHDNVAQTEAQQEVEAQDETGRDSGGNKRRKGRGLTEDDNRIVPPEDPDAHNCDVTV